MIDWLSLFQEASERIRQEVKPIFGSEKARESAGRGAGGDISKYIDLLAEEIVVKILEAEDISCVLISEECGMRKIGKGSGGYVVLDSIDGTTNATRSIPFVSTSIAHAEHEYLNSVDVALVRDLYRGIAFTAIKGKGAFGNGKPLSPSSIDSLGKAIMAIDLGPKEKLSGLVDRVLPILSMVLKIRHLGSTALELCYVASGALDVFMDLRGLTRATDLAAAFLVLKESGGSTVTPLGEELNMSLKADAHASFISTANKALCTEILNCLKPGKG
ncbi:MAG: inositol monophosphatase family protein [Candidatus Bathyarchaeota archaeon]